MNRTLIIAEAGVNHNGDINLAKKLIDIADDAGADYVKFQTFKAESLVSKSATQADYQIVNTKKKESQLNMLKRLELSDNDFIELIEYCKPKNVKFLSTAFDFQSITFLKDKIDFFKIPSGELTNLPYLEKVAQLKLPIVMSTGMATLAEVEQSLNIFLENGLKKKQISILHCNTEYPTPAEDVNLKAMLTIKNALGVKVGYSDHTLGIEVPIAAVALGASIIEKHFTIDKNMQGPDHKASLNPHELKTMVQGIRTIEAALGDGVKKPSASESKNIQIARKSIVASMKINKGDIFTEDNLTVKRPGHGISPMQWYTVIGTKANKQYFKDDMIEL